MRAAVCHSDLSVQSGATLEVIRAERTMKRCWHGSSNLGRDIARLANL